MTYSLHPLLDDGIAAADLEGFAANANAWRRLPALVFCQVNAVDKVHDSFYGNIVFFGDLFWREKILDIALKHGIYNRVIGQSIAIFLIGAKLGRGRPF